MKPRPVCLGLVFFTIPVRQVLATLSFSDLGEVSPTVRHFCYVFVTRECSDCLNKFQSAENYYHQRCRLMSGPQVVGNRLTAYSWLIRLLPTFHAVLSASSHPQSGTVYRFTLDHSLQRQLRQLLLSILKLNFVLWHTPRDHANVTAHAIRLMEIDTGHVINSCTYLLNIIAIFI